MLISPSSCRKLKPILHTTQCRDSMSLTLSLAPLIGSARPFNNSWRLIEKFCSMSLGMFHPILTHWALWVLLCIHTLRQISGHWLLMCHIICMDLVHWEFHMYHMFKELLSLPVRIIQINLCYGNQLWHSYHKNIKNISNSCCCLLVKLYHCVLF